jgi:hypothetical protein
MRDRRTRARAAALLGALWLGGAVATACGDSATSPSSQGGDDVVNDTRDASPRAPANPDDGAAPNGNPDGYAPGQPESGAAYGTDAPAVTYPGVAECASCSCPSSKAYCFGGATARGEPMVSVQAATGDAGPPCPMVPAGSLGCTALPAGATNCADLNAVLQASYSCYLVCAFNGTTMTVYCPNP